jgi:hypothetical protein
MRREGAGHTCSPPRWSTRRTCAWSTSAAWRGATACSSSARPPTSCGASSSTTRAGGTRRSAAAARPALPLDDADLPNAAPPPPTTRSTCSRCTRRSTASPRSTPDQARLVELRYFGGLNIDETAEALGVSPATVKREWAIARSWLRRELRAP